MILPVMSEATSTLVCGRTWPLAVTEAVRSRFSTFSRRTSTALVLFFVALKATMLPTSTTATTPAMTFVFFVIYVFLSGELVARVGAVQVLTDARWAGWCVIRGCGIAVSSSTRQPQV